MTAPDLTDERLTGIEIKLSYTEDLLDTLNDTVVRQQETIDLLLREVLQLKRQSADGASPGARGLRDDLPPHY